MFVRDERTQKSNTAKEKNKHSVHEKMRKRASKKQKGGSSSKETLVSEGGDNERAR
jgi:hypothetical protein